MHKQAIIPFIIALVILFFGLLGHLLENGRNSLPLARLLDFNGIWIMSSVEPSRGCLMLYLLHPFWFAWGGGWQHLGEQNTEVFLYGGVEKLSLITDFMSLYVYFFKVFVGGVWIVGCIPFR